MAAVESRRPSIRERPAKRANDVESLAAEGAPARAACSPAPAFRPATAVATSSHMPWTVSTSEGVEQSA